jgi:hypothetical protein
MWLKHASNQTGVPERNLMTHAATQPTAPRIAMWLVEPSPWFDQCFQKTPAYTGAGCSHKTPT